MVYYFHIRADGILISDDEGMALLDIYAARAELIASANDLAMANLRAGGSGDNRTIEIEDENGNVLESIAVTPVLH